MDVESDDSERWEDFFGSSTDLTPSLLGIYDSLTSRLDGGEEAASAVDSNSNSNSNDDNSDSFITCHSNTPAASTRCSSASASFTLHHSVEVEEYEAEENVVELDVCAESFQPDLHSSAYGSSLTLTTGAGGTGSNHSSASSSLSSLSPTSCSFSSGSSSKSRETSSRHRNNIRVLSPNVQRIITHSEAEPIEAIDIGALQQQQAAPQLQSPVQQQRLPKKSSPTVTPHSGHKLKLSHIPLSKITEKLTQSGSELVETFDSSCEYLDALSVSHSERGTTRKPPTPAVVPIPSTADEDKTPTNPASPFNFDLAASASGKARKLSLPKQDSLKLLEMEQLDTEQQPLSNGNSQSNEVSPTAIHNAKEFVATAPLDACELVEAVNTSFVSQRIEELGLADAAEETLRTESVSSNSSELIAEAINKPLISKPLVRSVSAACASTITGSPLLTYARSKSLAAKANTLGGAVPIKLPTAEQLAELEEASQLSAESLDRLMDIKSRFSPKESRKISGLLLPDIAKLKHRPLSSSSICSTSSSSSSGSDQLNGKLMATSYLASVESLADPSENESLDPHSGMSVFERACMEIVDSERSYVEDLGQVIRGYLLDWKERACLRYDELRTLFANIEEVYEFNVTLLRQLVNSGLDPAKIARCFIDLRERFDVYTTYCTSYPEAISLLTRLLQATHTNSLLTSTQKMLQHTLPLGSYLLKPVQRILKYHLLLDNLRKHCDVKEAFQAHEIMRQVARHIDQVKRKLEQQSRVKELSGILDGWLGPELTVLGELRQEGLLLEHNKPRMVFLFGTMLIITKPKEDSRLQFKSYIHQNNLMLSEHLPGDPTSFYVIPYDEPRNQIKLTAKNRDQKRLWAQHIKGVILEKFDNIPSRAKELVYKLGDEEDRTPDKNIWKWSLHSLHSTSTPVYLERRNQYRRSEMRNRSKMKRKTVTNSSSFESFNEAAESTLDGGHQTLSRNKSMDDNMLPALQKLAAVLQAGKQEAALDAEDCSCGNASLCKCVLRGQRSSARCAPKSPIFGGKALKERSKSVPRISCQVDDYDAEGGEELLHASSTNLDARKSKSSKSVDIKQYSAKMLPKRIATLRKQRSSKKETSKFYLDLSEFETNTETVLKITESSENLDGQADSKSQCDAEPRSEGQTESGNHQPAEAAVEPAAEETLSPAEKAKKDAQIILELLKNNKEFDRLGKKPQKKRASDSAASPGAISEPQRDLPPRPPSKSPPPLDSEGDSCDGRPAAEEHIYESLLRNVHVPYKFSPVLGRSHSATADAKQRDKPTQPRPESDYVTLVYSAEGTLQQVGADVVERVENGCKLKCEATRDTAADPRDSNASSTSSSSASSSTSFSSCCTLKRDSQSTVVSVDLGASSSSGYLSQISTSTPEAIYARPLPKNLMKRLLGSAAATTAAKNSLENVASSEISLFPRGRKSIESLALSFGRCNKPPERRVSDVTEMCRQSIIHRQGSESVGERMAHVDYADPRAFVNLMSMNSSDASLQRDSVFSLTSSSDSVCDAKRSGSKPAKASGFEYEENVEATLETDFRDSAVYSDDNEKRPDCEYLKRPSSPPPPPPARNRSHPQVPPKPSAKSTPAKSPPAAVPKSPTRTTRSSAEKAANGTGEREGDALAAKAVPTQGHSQPNPSRSWVLQQIENFNK